RARAPHPARPHGGRRRRPGSLRAGLASGRPLRSGARHAGSVDLHDGPHARPRPPAAGGLAGRGAGRRRPPRREEPSDAAPGVTEPPRTEQALAVRKALDSLSPDQRSALELAYYEGLTQTEIAAPPHQPLGTIQARTPPPLTPPRHRP